MATRPSRASWRVANERECRFIYGMSRGRRRRNCRKSLRPRCLPTAPYAGARDTLPDLLAGHPCLENLGACKCLGIDLDQIAVDQDEVGPFTGSEASDLIFCKPRVGSAPSEPGQRPVEANPLLASPSARRLASHVLPADRCGEAGEWIGTFHREVGSECQRHSRPGDGLPGVSAL